MGFINICVLTISGGFAYVFTAQDTNTGKEYALKVGTYKF